MVLGDDEKTPIVCLACGGRWKTERLGQHPLAIWCKWCIEGVMTESQRKRWATWSKRQKEWEAKRKKK
jgi:hypothetical protein